MRVVDPEHPDPAVAPAEDDVQERVPESVAVVGVPVEVVDVLVALRRVLGELDRAVRTPLEPVGMLREPGVVGRALDREVEGDLDPGRRGCRDHGVEIGLAAEVGVQRSHGRLRPRRLPRGFPTSPATDISALLRPLRLVTPIGCTGGR